jgi:hypothetical protein
MDSSNEQRAAERLPEILAELLNVPLSDVRLRAFPGKELDFVVEVQGRTLLIEHKSSGDLSRVATAAQQLKAFLTSRPGDESVPVVLVPYLGPAGRAYCREAGVSCLDLSGNAEMSAPGLRLMVEGRPNRFGRPATSVAVFAPKSSRVVRRLLMDPARAFTQRELSTLSGLDEGFVSRIVRRLESDSLVARDENGRVRAAMPALLLDAWREQYKFAKHEIVRGHVPAPSPESLMRSIARVMDEACPDRYAMTGLCAAWLYTHFASFRSLVVYAREPSLEMMLEPLGFQAGERGANVSLVIPNDDGVFEGSEYLEGVSCVSPVQTYLDLKGAGERSEEASEQMKQYFVARLRSGEQAQPQG